MSSTHSQKDCELQAISERAHRMNSFSMCGVVTVLLVILCEAEANTTVNNCVSDYEEFEEKTFSN